MKPWVSWPAAALVFYCAAVFQHAVASSFAVFGACPDLLLVVSCSLALVTRPGAAAFVGFWGGLLQGALAGANLTHYVFSRVAACFGLAWTHRLELQVGVLMAALLVALGTIVAQLMLMFLAPSPEIGRYLGDTMVAAIYNGILAIPIYSLLRLLFQPKAV